MGVTPEKDLAGDNFSPVEQEISDELEVKIKKYLRGEGANLEVLQDKKLKGQLAVREELYGKSAKAAAKVEKWLMPSEGGYLEPEGIEKTWRIKQEDIAHEVDILSARNQYDIVLPELGPYTLDFTASGRYMAAAGRKGHLALVDMNNLNLVREIQVRETVHDVVFLHNELFFAAAQKKYPYIYNREGTELHCLKEHGTVTKLQFLKNHFLLASINKFGQLRYQDVTMGEMVSNFRTGMGRTDVMQVNPFNGVVALGHSGGTVTMWKPTSAVPLVKMLCHPGPISALAFHPNGHLMATSGKEKKIKIWDLRKFEVIQTLPGHARTLNFSQKGLLAAATGSFVQILRDSSDSQSYGRYMNHSMVKGYQIGKVLFRPYEDVLGIGHSMGWSSILIPGSGEPNFDSWVANPYETSKLLRPRRGPACSTKNGVLQEMFGGDCGAQEGKQRAGSSEPKSMRLRGLAAESAGAAGGDRKKEKLKFWISLSKDEIEEDIFIMTGSRPARRPKKRPKNVQKQLDNAFPGLWLVGTTADSYRVADPPVKI